MTLDTSLTSLQFIILLFSLGLFIWTLVKASNAIQILKSWRGLCLSLIFIATIIANFNPTIRSYDQRKLRILVCDTSASYQETLKQHLARPALLLNGLEAEDQVAVVTFAAEAAIAFLPAPPKSALAHLAQMNPSAATESNAGSNIASALKRAYDLAQTAKRQTEVVLLSDGFATHGHSLSALSRQPKSCQTYAFIGDFKELQDTRLQNLQANGELRLGQAFQWRVLCESTRSQSAQLLWTVTRDDKTVFQQQSRLSLKASEQVPAEFRHKFDLPGQYAVNCELIGEINEAFKANNKLTTFVEVTGQRTLLIIGPQSLNSVLTKHKATVFSNDKIQFLSLNQLQDQLSQQSLKQRPDIILVANSSLKLLDQFYSGLANYLQATQTQLITVAQAQNLVKTAERRFEALLPIQLDDPENDSQDTQLVIGLDCSGSMEQDYALVLEACRQLPLVIDDSTKVSLIVFNNTIRFEASLVPLQKLDQSLDQAAQFKPRGPTSLARALTQIAQSWSKHSNYKQRAIVLSDGRNQLSESEQKQLKILFRNSLGGNQQSDQKGELFIALIGAEEIPKALQNAIRSLQSPQLKTGVFAIEQMRAAYEQALQRSASDFQETLIRKAQAIQTTPLGLELGLPNLDGSLNPVRRVKIRRNSQTLVETQTKLPIVVQGRSLVGPSLFLGAGLKFWLEQDSGASFRKILNLSQIPSRQQLRSRFDWQNEQLKMTIERQNWSSNSQWTKPWTARWFDQNDQHQQKLQNSAPGEQFFRLPVSALQQIRFVDLFDASSQSLGRITLPSLAEREQAVPRPNYAELRRLTQGAGGAIVANLGSLPRPARSEFELGLTTLCAIVALVLLVSSFATKPRKP